MCILIAEDDKELLKSLMFIFQSKHYVVDGSMHRGMTNSFLCEACVLSILGGLIGLGLSFTGIQIYNPVAGTSTAMNRAVGSAAIVFCAVIGIVFGGDPAAKASQLQPIDALHNS